MKVLAYSCLLLLCIISPCNSIAQLSITSDTDGWEEFRAGNYKGARNIWQPQANNGDGDAALGMAILHENGLGTPRDIKQSVRWYQIAADQGLPEAQHDLGIKYFTGSGVAQDNQRAYQLWKAAAESGLGTAQAKLAYLYTKGVGTKKNHKEALRWYRQAIKQNNGEAMYNMSLLHQTGTGVPKDHRLFLHWLRQAATYEYPRAQYDLGLMLMHGMDIEKSVSEGKKWLLEAANNGLVDAQYYLGTLFLNGHILAPDREKAMILLSEAARQGHQGAKQTILDLKLAKNNTSGIKLGNKAGSTTKTHKPVAEKIKSTPPETNKPITLTGKLPAQIPASQKTDDTSWVSRQSADAFTIQILASQNEPAARKYAASLPSNLNAYIFSYRQKNKRWYVVASGIHASHALANAALKKFPAKIRKSKPWVRNIGILQKMIQGS